MSDLPKKGRISLRVAHICLEDGSGRKSPPVKISGIARSPFSYQEFAKSDPREQGSASPCAHYPCRFCDRLDCRSLAGARS